MSSFGVVASLVAPTLNGVTQPELIKFEIQYAACKQKVVDINRSRDADRHITPASIRLCIEPVLMQSLCLLGQIRDATTFKDATDESVQKWFEGRLETSPEDLTERVRASLDAMESKTSKQDPSGAALSFVVRVVAELDKNNASEIIRDKEMSNSLTAKLVQKLEPPELRERVRDARDCWSSDQKSDLTYFQSRVSAVAVEVSQGEIARERLSRRGQRQGKNGGKYGSSTVVPTIKKHKSRVPHRALHPAQTPTGGRRGTGSEKWDKKCLNPDCGGIHRLADCTTTPDTQKKVLFDAYRASRKARMKAVKVDDEPPPLATGPSAGRFQVRLEDSVLTTALGDCGSDESALSKALLDRVLSETRDLVVSKFRDAMPLSAAIKSTLKNPISFTASGRVSLTITIYSPDSNLPIRIHQVPFLVVDQEMEEILLGRPFLDRIGFDLRKHLVEIGPSLHGKNFADINTHQVTLAASTYKGLRYGGDDDDPVPFREAAGANIGVDKPCDIDAAFQAMVKDAEENGLSPEGQRRLLTILQTYRNVFRIQLGPDPPAKVAPLIINLRQNSKPFRSPQRRYAPPQRNFISTTIRKLEAVGAVYKNPTARWASPALAVPKSGSEGFRFTVDLRGPNSQTDPIASSMPHLESQLQGVQASTCFANIDMAHAYWQLPLADKSQELLSIQTPLGVYSSTRILQGSTDAGNHFQSVTRAAFEEHLKNILQWLNDFLSYAISESEIIKFVDNFLNICDRYNFKVHAQKSRFFLKNVKFCGRIISEDGIRFDPRHIESLLKMKTPSVGGDLQQFICATNWMRVSIPNYSSTIAPLHDLMETIYKKAGSRTKRSVAKKSLADSWGAVHDAAFDNIKRQLARTTQQAHPKDTCYLCLFTDASETHWAGVLTQVVEGDLKKPIAEQAHEPLAFLSGSFSGASSSWSVPKKEGFAVIESMERLDYIVGGRTVAIFTDHANLVYLFDPYGRNPGMAKHTANKLMRWALKLSSYRYVIEHLSGDSNVWADMLTRWTVQPKTAVTTSTSIKLKSLMLAPISPHIDSELDWPTLTDIQEAQQHSTEVPPKRFSKKKGVFRTIEGVCWVPSSAEKLQLRILVAGHTGVGGHRGYRSTQLSIGAFVWWKTIARDVETFVKSCLHCLSSQTGDMVPRPRGSTIHASRPNEVIHFDYCFLMKGEHGFTYVLILKDDFSGYVWLIPTAQADALSTAKALLSWFAAFGTVLHWVSDRGSHFKNEVVKNVQDQTGSSHHFTLAYCPWSNGTVEVVCRELLRAARALLSEYQIPQRAWPSIIPLIQSALNSTPLPRLDNHCPLRVFTGLPQDSPLLSIVFRDEDSTKMRAVSAVRSRQVMKISKTMQSLDRLHKEVARKSSKKRSREIERHNLKTGVRPIEFVVGDFVLRGVFQHKTGFKPAVRWRGPYRVISAVSDYIFEIEDLMSGDRSEAHGRRLKFFRSSDYEVTEELRNQLAYQKNELLVVKNFHDIRSQEGGLQLLTSWRGFEDAESDWTSLELMKEDVPVLVREFLDELRKSGTARQKQLLDTV